MSSSLLRISLRPEAITVEPSRPGRLKQKKKKGKKKLCQPPLPEATYGEPLIALQQEKREKAEKKEKGAFV